MRLLRCYFRLFLYNVCIPFISPYNSASNETSPPPTTEKIVALPGVNEAPTVTSQRCLKLLDLVLSIVTLDAATGAPVTIVNTAPDHEIEGISLNSSGPQIVPIAKVDATHWKVSPLRAWPSSEKRY